MIHGNGWEEQITGYGVDQNLEFSNYTDHRPIMCVFAVRPTLGKGSEDKRERRPWTPVIKHKDLVERFQKKMDRWHTTNATHLGTLQVEERYTEVVKATGQQKPQATGGEKCSVQARLVTGVYCYKSQARFPLGGTTNPQT